ncbi:MAG: GNAT family N-acetyltransferase [Methanobacteriota archaeon]
MRGSRPRSATFIPVAIRRCRHKRLAGFDEPRVCGNRYEPVPSSLHIVATNAPVRIRLARPRDLPACSRLFVRSIRDLVRRQRERPPPFRARNLRPIFRLALTTDPKGFHVAVSRGRIVCFGISILRAKTHFLAQFFALPGFQSLGIGRQVLSRVFEEPRPPPGTVRTVVASLDHRAQALYLKFGMLPRTMIYTMTGKPPRRMSTASLELVPVGPAGRSTKQARDLAARFDARLRGARRDEDFRFWSNAVPGTRFFAARLRGRTVGYVLIRGNGVIGPGGVRDASLSEPLLRAALARARALGMKKVTVWIPGLNEGALRAAFAAGLKVEFLTVWMSSRKIGDLGTYIPSGGVLF